MPDKKEKKIDHDFVQRIKHVVEKAGGQMALARKMGISQGGVQRYLAGGEPTRPMLLKMSKAANIDLNWIIYGNGSPEMGDATVVDFPQTSVSSTALPLYAGAAEDGKSWEEQKDSAQSFDLSISDKDAFAVRITDTSMAAEGLKPGYTCIASPNQQPQSGDIVFIKKDDGSINFASYVSENMQGYQIKLSSMASESDGRSVITYTTQSVARGDVELFAPVALIKTR